MILYDKPVGGARAPGAPPLENVENILLCIGISSYLSFLKPPYRISTSSCGVSILQKQSIWMPTTSLLHPILFKIQDVNQFPFPLYLLDKT